MKVRLKGKIGLALLGLGYGALSIVLVTLSVAVIASSSPSPHSSHSQPPRLASSSLSSSQPPRKNLRTYELVVVDGDGSGRYAAGSHALMTARNPHEGEEFAEWSFVPDGLTLAGGTVTSTSLTISMPDEKVVATARFRPKPPLVPEPLPRAGLSRIPFDIRTSHAKLTN